MSSTSLSTVPVHHARRLCVALQLRHLALRERRESGQGTVEYVALILLVGAIMAAVVTSGVKNDFKIGTTIGNKLKETIDGVGGGRK